MPPPATPASSMLVAQAGPLDQVAWASEGQASQSTYRSGGLVSTPVCRTFYLVIGTAGGGAAGFLAGVIAASSAMFAGSDTEPEPTIIVCTLLGAGIGGYIGWRAGFRRC